MAKLSKAAAYSFLLVVGLPPALGDCLKSDDDFGAAIEDLRKISACSVSNMAVCRDSLGLPAVGAAAGAAVLKSKAGTPRKIQIRVPKACTLSSFTAMEPQTLISLMTDLLLPPALAMTNCHVPEYRPDVQKDFMKLLEGESEKLSKEVKALDAEVGKAMENGSAKNYVTHTASTYDNLLRSHATYVDDLDDFTKISADIESKPYSSVNDELVKRRDIIGKRLDAYVARNAHMRSQLEALRSMGKMRLAGASVRVQSLVWRTQPGITVSDSTGSKITAPQSLAEAEGKAISKSRSLQALSEIRASARSPYQKSLTGAMEQFASRLAPSFDSFKQLFVLRAKIPTPVGVHSQIATRASIFGARPAETLTGKALQSAMDASRQIGGVANQGATFAGKRMAALAFGPAVLLVSEGFAATDTACQEPHQTNGVYSSDSNCKVMEMGDIGHALVGRSTEDLVKSMTPPERKSLCYAHRFYFTDDTQATCTKDGVNMRIPSRGLWTSSTYDAKGNLTNLGIFTTSDRIDIKYAGDIPDSISDEMTIGDVTQSATVSWKEFNGSPNFHGSKYQRYIPLAQARSEELRSCCSGYLNQDDPACAPIRRGPGGNSGAGAGSARK